MSQNIQEMLHSRSRDTPKSGIMELIHYGTGREGLIPLWAGEGDLPTPKFICEAAEKSLFAGETFYTRQRGIPELRQALANYYSRTYDKEFLPENFYVTASGMQAIQLSINAVAGPGDEVLVPTPAWPNFSATLKIAGCTAVEVPMDFNPTGWQLNLELLESKINHQTRAIFLNTPCNPTGWVATHDQLQTILNIARKHNLWIITDEVYCLYYFRDDAKRAPSFQDIMEPSDLILFPNTISKNWAMTGWRVGWIAASNELGGVFENLIQNSTSGVATFMQRACQTAIDLGDDFLKQQIEIARTGRELFVDALSNHKRIQMASPDGAFYLFFKIDGEDNSTQLAKRLVDEANIGLAPGSTFGKGGEGYLRLCFARNRENLEIALERLLKWLDR